MASFKLKCVSWNILADGMSSNEFVTNGGDKINTLWSSRFPRICSILSKFLDDGVQVIGLQENDHPYSILNEIQISRPEIRCVHLTAKGVKRSAENLRIIGIYEYLKSNNEAFRIQEQGSNENIEQDYDLMYSKINQWYKTNSLDHIQKKFTMTSFREEGSEILSKVLHRNLDDLYVVNDGVTLYYDSNVLKFVGAIPFSEITETKFPDLFMGHDLSCRFKIIDHNIASTSGESNFINIVCTHLRSGEGIENEKIRFDQLSKVLNLLNEQNEPSVILLDSNTSNLYKEEIQKTNPNEIVLVDNVITETGFQNIIPTQGNECFKMRHAQGAQPKKFGNIMFDTIDKILIQNKWSCDFESCRPDWLKTLPMKYYDEVLAWRLNPTKRHQLQSMCIENRWGDDMSQNEMTGSMLDRTIFSHLYPNQEMPSDHPPVMANITYKL